MTAIDAPEPAVHRALPPGAVRRRAVYGLLDADGWAWAFWKGLFWFLFIIFLEGYLPDRLYYFTVSPTVDVGYNIISPVNFCDPSNKTLPCPAPAGAVVPWEQSPPQAALPEARAGGPTVSSGVNLYLVGGRGPDGVARADVFATSIDSANFAGGWQAGPALPAPRADAVVISLSGTPYVIGGRDQSGNPTNTVYQGTIKDGALTGWQEMPNLALPAPLAESAGVATTKSIWIFGGKTTGDALQSTVYVATLGTSGKLGAWTTNTELPLPEARADQSAVLTGNFIYVLGGTGPSGVSNSVYFLALNSTNDPKVDPTTQQSFGWGVSVGPAAGFALPAPRAKHVSFANSGSIYVLGGVGADGRLTNTNYWATPDPVSGTLGAGWNHLDVTDLPAPLADAGVADVSSTAFLIGGDTVPADVAGSPTANAFRANLAPQRPFFRLGFAGVTIPALSIKGEIGQQLGYLVAGGVALGNFVILVIIGIAYSHRRETRRFLAWVTRGRFRPPPEDAEPQY